MPGAELTLNFSSAKGSEIGRKLRLNKTFLNYLSPGGFGKTEEVPEGKHTETRPTEPQKLSFGQSGTGYGFVKHEAFHKVE